MEKLSVKEIEDILMREVALILSVDISSVKRDAPLQTLGMDSFGFVELLVSIEKNFNIKLIETGLNRKDFRTISSLASCISRIK